MDGSVLRRQPVFCGADLTVADYLSFKSRSMTALLKMHQTNVLWPLILARADVERLDIIEDLRRIAYCIISYSRQGMASGLHPANPVRDRMLTLRYDSMRAANPTDLFRQESEISQCIK